MQRQSTRRFCRMLGFTILLTSFAAPTARAQFELHKAVEAGDVARVKKLLADKADPNRRQPKPKVPPKKEAFDFMTDGELSILLARQAQEAHAELPLHCAIYMRHVKLVPLLLAAGANPNLKLTETNWTALHVATRLYPSDVREILDLLLKAGGDPNVAEPRGSSLLHMLVEANSEDGLALVLKQKVKVDPMDRMKRTPLRWAVQSNRPKLARLLLKAGADVNTTDGFETPLHAALWRGNPDLANELIQAGANPMVRDQSGQTLLHNIALWPNPEYALATRFALRHKVPINAKDQDGNTALHLAFMGNRNFDEDVFVALVKAGADLALKNNKGETVLDVAIKKDNYEAVTILLIKMKPGQRVDVMKLLNKTRKRIRWQNTQLQEVEEALDKGAKVNDMRRAPFIHSPYVFPGTDVRWPMLSFAASYKNSALVDLLIERGADVDAATEGGHPRALDIAAAQGCWVMVNSLLKAKADPTKTLALRAACEKGHVEIARLLLENGAQEQFDPLLETATRRRDLDMIDLLREFKRRRAPAK